MLCHKVSSGVKFRNVKNRLNSAATLLCASLLASHDFTIQMNTPPVRDWGLWDWLRGGNDRSCFSDACWKLRNVLNPTAQRRPPVACYCVSFLRFKETLQGHFVLSLKKNKCCRSANRGNVCTIRQTVGSKLLCITNMAWHAFFIYLFIF